MVNFLYLGFFGLFLLATQLIGGFHHEFDSHDGDLDHDHGLFNLSLRSIAMFFISLGFFAYGTSTYLAAPWAILIGFSAGFLSFVMVNYLFKLAMKLKSDGTINYSSAVGAVGTVYATIKPGGTGMIQVPISGRLVTIAAVSEEGNTFHTGSQVAVKRTVGDLMFVESVKG